MEHTAWQLHVNFRSSAAAQGSLPRRWEKPQESEATLVKKWPVLLEVRRGEAWSLWWREWPGFCLAREYLGLTFSVMPRAFPIFLLLLLVSLSELEITWGSVPHGSGFSLSPWFSGNGFACHRVGGGAPDIRRAEAECVAMPCCPWDGRCQRLSRPQSPKRRFALSIRRWPFLGRARGGGVSLPVSLCQASQKSKEWEQEKSGRVLSTPRHCPVNPTRVDVTSS